MLTFPNSQLKQLLDTEDILRKAELSLSAPCRHITDVAAPLSQGTLHDYYSNGDYWWPDPSKPDGLPYIQRDGESNPDNFSAHRQILRHTRTHVANLAAGYRLTKKEKYARAAIKMLWEFFLDPDTRMNPRLPYAQALPGICPGRGIGIIDTLHLIDIPFAVDALLPSQAMNRTVYLEIRRWFSQYLAWMLHHKNGIEESRATNNHSVCFFVQAAVFALFTENTQAILFCREQFKNVLMQQMAEDGSFPRELGRTKPYAYSIFVLDNMITLCHLLSTEQDNLWHFTTENGRSIQKAVDFLLPFLLDKSQWPYAKDVQHFEGYPIQASYQLFAGLGLENRDLLQLYTHLPRETQDQEVLRNTAIRQPLLFL